VKLRLVSAFPHIVKDCPKMRNIPKIFVKSFKNVDPDINCDLFTVHLFLMEYLECTRANLERLSVKIKTCKNKHKN